MTDKPQDPVEVVPFPASDSQADHDRIRKSNDRDQELERQGRPARHNQGYDEVLPISHV